jgi:hypothetical protein
MNAVERLKQDHERFRATCNALEGALQLWPETRLIVRELCFTLSRGLEEHDRREEALIASCHAPLSAGELTQLAEGHSGESHMVRAALQRLLEEPSQGLDEVQPHVADAITRSRSHMDEQEYKLFPALEWVLSTRGGGQMSEQSTAVRLTEGMTVREVLRRYPGTKTAFGQFFIDTWFEGYDCLDEVAWRHGVDTERLLAHLEEAIQCTGAAGHPRSTEGSRPSRGGEDAPRGATGDGVGVGCESRGRLFEPGLKMH